MFITYVGMKATFENQTLYLEDVSIHANDYIYATIIHFILIILVLCSLSMILHEMYISLYTAA